MYNPCRGGVRGGADQFTWESVKTDKHRENYLGHSLKAPVGRWQKGKDLSWYAKERKDEEGGEGSEMAAVKRAEEEAMMIALGHKVVRKESLPVLSKEEMTEALRRNVGERDDQNIERIDGVGASTRRAAQLTGDNKVSKTEGVEFIANRERKSNNPDRHSSPHQKTKDKKKSKKRKKEKKSKHNSDDSDSEDTESRRKHKKVKSYPDPPKDRFSSPETDSEDSHYKAKVSKDKKKSKKEKKEKKSKRNDSDSEDASTRRKHKKSKRGHDSRRDRSSSPERHSKDQNHFRTKK